MKKIVSCFLAIVLLFMFGISTFSFSDVTDKYAWAKDAILALANKKVVEGIGNDVFGVDKNITREQIAKILCLAFEISVQKEQEQSFKDVPASRWSFDYVETLKNCFLVQDSKFEPTKELTREELVYIIVKTLKLEKDDNTDKEILYRKFIDAIKISSQYTKEVAIAIQEGIMTGYENHMFLPQNLVTRAEAAVMITNIIGVDEPPENNVFQDRGERKMDMMMLYDIDLGVTINDRPDNGWWHLTPEYPDDPKEDVHSRTTTPLLGTYDSSDKKLIKQHFYWMSALGCNAVQSDFTNWRSPREEGITSKKFFNGIYRAFENSLKVVAEVSEFDCPKPYPMMRLNGTEYANLQLMVDDMYKLYEKYPESWFKFKDGSENEEKPFMIIFADWDLLGAWSREEKNPFADERFNIRWSNGFFAGVQGTTESDSKGTKILKEKDPYWLFVENEEMPGKNGYYRPFVKKSAYGKQPEQMITWASVWKGYSNWDGLLDKVDEKLAIERYTTPVYDYMPKALLINRWNYPLAWLSQAQEGVSRNKSTHIEPNVDWRFEVFNNVTREMYKVQSWKMLPPPNPKVEKFNGKTMELNLSGYPLEYRISNNKNFDSVSWEFLNIGTGGIKIDEKINFEKSIFIQTRNTFGESGVTTYKVNPEDVEKPQEETEDGVVLIKTIEQLQEISGNGKYRLAASLDLSDVDWIPISGFNGKFDGNSSAGFFIENLNGSGCDGLFGVVNEGVEIKNLTIKNADLTTTGSLAGVLASRIISSTVENIRIIDATIRGGNFLGGLMGVNDHSFVNKISLENVNVLAEGSTVGGVVGYSEFGINQNIYFSGNVEAEQGDMVGGIVGKLLGTKDDGIKGVENSFVFGTVKGSKGMTNIGGIAGSAQNEDRAWPAPIYGCGSFLTSISGGGTGKIVGGFTEGYLKNNVGIDTLKVSGIKEGEDKKDGKTIKKDEIKNINIDKSIWEFDSEGLPKLK